MAPRCNGNSKEAHGGGSKARTLPGAGTGQILLLPVVCLCPQVFKNLIMKTGRLRGTGRAGPPRSEMGGTGGKETALGWWRGGNAEGGLEGRGETERPELTRSTSK